jgi:hypothetical protein
MQHHVYSIRYSVAQINSSLLIIYNIILLGYNNTHFC